MEAHHAEVGGYLLGLWGFPEPIVEAIVWHHTPSRTGEPGLGLSGLVHIGDLLAHAAEPLAPSRQLLAEQGYLESLGLHDRWPVWQKLRSEPQAAEDVA
jgi:HD-like signal output (HDOD) protein